MQIYYAQLEERLRHAGNVRGDVGHYCEEWSCAEVAALVDEIYQLRVAIHGALHILEPGLCSNTPCGGCVEDVNQAIDTLNEALGPR